MTMAPLSSSSSRDLYGDWTEVEGPLHASSFRLPPRGPGPGGSRGFIIVRIFFSEETKFLLWISRPNIVQKSNSFKVCFIP